MMDQKYLIDGLMMDWTNRNRLKTDEIAIRDSLRGGREIVPVHFYGAPTYVIPPSLLGTTAIFVGEYDVIIFKT